MEYRRPSLPRLRRRDVQRLQRYPHQPAPRRDDRPGEGLGRGAANGVVAIDRDRPGKFGKPPANRIVDRLEALVRGGEVLGPWGIRHVFRPKPHGLRRQGDELAGTARESAGLDAQEPRQRIPAGGRRAPRPRSPASASASRRSTTASGSSATCATISASSTWSRRPCNLATTRSGQGCHPCLSYDLSPMCPGRTR
jgi:hypothetical protein